MDLTQLKEKCRLAVRPASEDPLYWDDVIPLLIAAVESLTAEKEALEEELVSTATGLLPDCMMPDGGNGPCAAYREQLRLVESLAGISVQWSEQMCTERVGRQAAESSLAQAREEIKAAEQREKGLREALEKIAPYYLPHNMGMLSLFGKIAVDAIEKNKSALAAASKEEA